MTRVPVVIIDVDNCLYHSDRIHGDGRGPGLVARAIHRYCKAKYGLTAAESDGLFRAHGDTLVGLERTGRVASAEDVADYFRGVFGRLKVASHILQPDDCRSGGDCAQERVSSSSYVPTGIEHATQLRSLLRALPVPKILASNSPRSVYVDRVLEALRMAAPEAGEGGDDDAAEDVRDDDDDDDDDGRNGSGVGWADVITPESFLPRGTNKGSGGGGSDGSRSCAKTFAVTKSDPRFWAPLLEAYPLERYRLMLFDDSYRNLAVAAAAGLETRLVSAHQRLQLSSDGSSEGVPPPPVLYDALLEFLGCLELPPPLPPAPAPLSPSSISISSAGVAYLAAKTAVDEAAINLTVRSDLVRHLQQRQRDSGEGGGEGDSCVGDSGNGCGGGKTNNDGCLRVVDVGAGSLSMLPRVAGAAAEAGFRRLEYCAVELQPELAAAGVEELRRRFGFRTTDDHVPLHATTTKMATILAGPPVVGTLPLSSDGNGDVGGVGSVGCGGDAMDLALCVVARELTTLREADVLAALGCLDSGNKSARVGNGGVDGGRSGGSGGGVDLVVACSFADLLPPRVFAVAMAALAPAALLYLPITFAGGTALSPPTNIKYYTPPNGCQMTITSSSSSSSNGSSGGKAAIRVPSDEEVAEAYHSHLIENEGQFIDTDALVDVLAGPQQEQTMEKLKMEEQQHEPVVGSGYRLLSDGRSDWRIDPRDPLQLPMWLAMIRFVGRAVPSRLWPRGLAIREWLRRVRRGGGQSDDSGEPRQLFVVRNRDLLLQIPGSSMTSSSSSSSSMPLLLPTYNAMFLTAPRTVEVREVRRTQTGLGAGEVEVQSIESLISTGTELKFFRGDFTGGDGDGDGGDDDNSDGNNESLDTTIASLAGQGMAYPMQYGYSLVGRVVAAGADVDLRCCVGRLAFIFHPHASACIAPADSIMFVPEGIATADAVFLPAVETALSIAHDCHPRAGESVAVFGQGLIGLLVTAVLAKTMGVAVTAVDGIPRRRALARKCGAVVVAAPGGLAEALAIGHSTSREHDRDDDSSRQYQKFDVTVEVSGNPEALDAAVAATRAGGTCVVASWYPKRQPVALRLGTAFHRSHVAIVASQVSELSAAVSATWTKRRRFDHAWRLIRQLRPATLLSSSGSGVCGRGGDGGDLHTARVALADIQRAYEALDVADAVTARVVYNKQHTQNSRL